MDDHYDPAAEGCIYKLTEPLRWGWSAASLPSGWEYEFPAGTHFLIVKFHKNVDYVSGVWYNQKKAPGAWAVGSARWGYSFVRNILIEGRVVCVELSSSGFQNA